MDHLVGRQIENAYISVEIKNGAMTRFRNGLRESLSSEGQICEDASESIHVSIAYGLGSVGFETVEQTVSEIADSGFQTRATGFEILQGTSTPYDYLVLSLEAQGDFQQAVEIVSGRMPTKTFAEGFKSHVSLLRFPKGSLGSDRAQALVRELNASHGAMFALGRCLCVEGECVCVFTAERQCCLQIPFEASATAA